MLFDVQANDANPEFPLLLEGEYLHFVGIGGAGMSGLAHVALQLGAVVTGSDQVETGTTQRLRQAGAHVYIGHAQENLPSLKETQVIYSTAVPADNPERAGAQQKGFKQLHRGQLLARFAAFKRCIAVTGTHGKTTTTAMIVHILRAAGKDPAYVVGSEVKTTGKSASWGGGDWIIVEADESDKSFLYLQPEVSIITNVELDHHTTYGSLDELYEAFQDFSSQTQNTLIIWGKDPQLLKLATAVTEQEAKRLVPYSVDAFSVDRQGCSHFQFHGENVSLSLPGEHMASNATAALHAAELAGVPANLASQALETFASTSRRFEQLGETSSGAVVIDDYAHHPTEVAATLAAARSLSFQRVVVVFQPHLFSRTQQLAAAFANALSAADLIVLLDIYPARELAQDFPSVSSAVIVDEIHQQAAGKLVYSFTNGCDVAGELQQLLHTGDICLMLGAGDITSLAHELVKK